MLSVVSASLIDILVSSFVSAPLVEPEDYSYFSSGHFSFVLHRLSIYLFLRKMWAGMAKRFRNW